MAHQSQPFEWKGPWPFLTRPGLWFYSVLVVGTGLRLFYACFTEGSLDVAIWQGHAECILEQGLLACYEGGRFTLNHPPPMSFLSAGLQHWSNTWELPFSSLFRLPFVALDAATAYLLFLAISRASHAGVRRYRYLFVALYWLNPLSAILSSYHGNTDVSVAFFLLASTLQAGQARGFLAGALLGLSLWIKVPGILGAPILFFALPDWRTRFHFGLGFGATLMLGYGPWLVQDLELVVRSVFLYPGLMIQTTEGIRIWGMDVFYPVLAGLDPGLSPWILELRQFHYQWNTVICLVPILFFAVFRETRPSNESIMRGLAGTFILFYGLTDFWAFQYFAWSLPFWFLLGPRMAGATYLISFAYLYSLYAWLTGSPWLLGDWAFVEKSAWPTALLRLRDVAIGIFLLSALTLLFQTGREAWKRWQETRRPLSWL